MTATIFTVLFGFMVSEQALHSVDPTRSEQVADSVRERFGTWFGVAVEDGSTVEGQAIRSRTRGPSLGAEIVASPGPSFEGDPILWFRAADLFAGKTSRPRETADLQVRRLVNHVLGSAEGFLVLSVPAIDQGGMPRADRVTAVVSLLERMDLPRERIEIMLDEATSDRWSLQSRGSQ